MRVNTPSKPMQSIKKELSIYDKESRQINFLRIAKSESNLDKVRPISNQDYLRNSEKFHEFGTTQESFYNPGDFKESIKKSKNFFLLRNARSACNISKGRSKTSVSNLYATTYNNFKINPKEKSGDFIDESNTKDATVVSFANEVRTTKHSALNSKKQMLKKFAFEKNSKNSQNYKVNFEDSKDPRESCSLQQSPKKKPASANQTEVINMHSYFAKSKKKLKEESNLTCQYELLRNFDITKSGNMGSKERNDILMNHLVTNEQNFEDKENDFVLRKKICMNSDAIIPVIDEDKKIIKNLTSAFRPIIENVQDCHDNDKCPEKYNRLNTFILKNKTTFLKGIFQMNQSSNKDTISIQDEFIVKKFCTIWNLFLGLASQKKLFNF